MECIDRNFEIITLYLSVFLVRVRWFLPEVSGGGRASRRLFIEHSERGFG